MNLSKHEKIKQFFIVFGCILVLAALVTVMVFGMIYCNNGISNMSVASAYDYSIHTAFLPNELILNGTYFGYPSTPITGGDPTQRITFGELEHDYLGLAPDFKGIDKCPISVNYSPIPTDSTPSIHFYLSEQEGSSGYFGFNTLCSQYPLTIHSGDNLYFGSTSITFDNFPSSATVTYMCHFKLDDGTNDWINNVISPIDVSFKNGNFFKFPLNDSFVGKKITFLRFYIRWDNLPSHSLSSIGIGGVGAYLSDVTPSVTNNKVNPNSGYIFPNVLPYYQQYMIYQKNNSNAYDDGYNAGLEEGKKKGDDAKYNAGVAAGKILGHDEGFNEGYKKGVGGKNSFSDLANSIVMVPVNTITSLFNFDLFGFNVSDLVLALLTLCIVFGIVNLIMARKS